MADGSRDATSPQGYPGFLVSPTADEGFVRDALLEGISCLRSNQIVSLYVRLHPLSNVEPPTHVGQVVRHPTFGIGRIADVSDMGSQTRAVVEFNTAGRKTLILQYARLEPVG